MIDRKSMLGILGNLPDAMLMKALSVAGQAAPSDTTGFEGLAVEDNNHIEPWSQKTVAYNGGVDRPALVDKMWAKSDVNPAQVPAAGGVLESDVDPFLQTGGM